ncbi:MAG: N-acetylmuramoyl-L-alanine amidase [Armatimonadetes bacterium]|nr:N-acetylmuramoyl-L-alanine amidase [Armatimonadota bacterium]
MKRITAALFVFALMIVFSQYARAETVPVRVMIGTREAFLAPAPVFDGSRVLAPTSVLDSLGATRAESSGGKISVTSALGKTSEIETVNVNGGQMLAMDKVAQAAGADATWDAEKRTFTMLARLESVEFIDDTLKVNCSLPVSYKVTAWTSNTRLIVDLSSTRLNSPASEVYVGGELVERARMSQYTDTDTRVVLDLKKNAPYRIDSAALASQILLKVAENLPNAAIPQPAIKPNGKSERPFAITDVRIDTVNASRFDVIISTNGRGAALAAFSMSPPKISISLPGGTYSDPTGKYDGSHPNLKSASLVQDSVEPPKARLELSLKRLMVSDIRVEDSAITVSVRPPDKSGGKLSEKLIVVDPGHGGNQGGAQCNGVSEKNVNLKLAQALADALKHDGAQVIMTRSDDRAMGLAARPEVAVGAGADFFISLHCNSNGSPNSSTGIETYYHAQEPSPKILAYAVHDGVCATTGMCDRRARSDRSLYASGLAVLRRLEGSGIPGILVECGYINHSSDCARLLDSNYRKKLAQGIVAGLKEYVEGKQGQ